MVMPVRWHFLKRWNRSQKIKETGGENVTKVENVENDTVSNSTTVNDVKAEVKEVKVKLDEYGYYVNVAVLKDGTEIFVEL